MSSGLFNSPLSFFKMINDISPAKIDVAAKLSQIPVRPRGHIIPIKITGKINAVDTDIKDAGRGFSTASI